VVDDLTLQLSPRQIQWQVAPDLPPLVADADLLQQVFTHLLGNACKFSRSRTPAVIQVAWQRLDSGHCHISVQDNGVGFHTKQADQLFKVFGRLHPARDFEGLGLGLVQCRKMLERMGASVEATAELGAGCCVTLTLPAG
jgi:signal transduction histidine kinase